MTETTRPIGTRLQRAAVEWAAEINARTERWTEAAEWLKNLEIPRATNEVPCDMEPDGETIKVVGIDGRPAGPTTPDYLTFAVVDREAEVAQSQGPIVRRLRHAWREATQRVWRDGRGDDSRYDFCERDALRLTLLAALTFSADFDGSVLGLGWSWEAAETGEHPLEGRAWAWSIMTTEVGFEEAVADLLDEARHTLFPPRPSAAQKNKNFGDDDHRPASWFFDATGKTLSSDTLRMAVRNKRLRKSKKQGKFWLHSITEVCEHFSQFRGKIMAAKSRETERN